jgi:CBS domain-containing protein
MIIADILRRKGSAVVTITPGEPITTLLSRLAEHKIGAVVVVEADRTVGIVSERDIVRHLNRTGADVLQASVSDLMTTDVVSAAPSDPVDDIAAEMTERRVRHMPVVDHGGLVGIVTIGDVVAARMRELEATRGALENYITHG